MCVHMAAKGQNTPIAQQEFESLIWSRTKAKPLFFATFLREKYPFLIHFTVPQYFQKLPILKGIFVFKSFPQISKRCEKTAYGIGSDELLQIDGNFSICSKISKAAVLSLLFTAVEKLNPNFMASGVRSFTLSRPLPSFRILSPSAQYFQLSDKDCSLCVSGSRSLCLQSLSSIFSSRFSSFGVKKTRMLDLV